MGKKSKYIDADVLMEYLKQNWEPINDSFPMSFSLDQIKEALDEMPAADVEPVRHGEWIKGRCSICGTPEATDSLFDYLDGSDQKYCYSCGAKMDGGSE